MKRRNISTPVLLLTLAAVLGGCEKELMTYEGKESLYFDVRRGAEWIDPQRWPHEFFSTVAFGNILGDDSKLVIPVKVTGEVKDYDRTFTVTARPDSTTATAGSDYDGLQDSYTIKAGETGTQIELTFHRTKAMDGDTLRLQLQLHENEYFSLSYTDYGDYPDAYQPTVNKAFSGNHDAAVHNIFLYDVLTRPKQWSGSDVYGTGLFGKFSAKKFKLIMEVTHTTIEDFADEKTMPTARQRSIGETMAKYLLEKAKARTPVLDEDGTMMYFMAISDVGGDAAWQPFTKPEDYYK